MVMKYWVDTSLMLLLMLEMKGNERGCRRRCPLTSQASWQLQSPGDLPDPPPLSLLFCCTFPILLHSLLRKLLLLDELIVGSLRRQLFGINSFPILQSGSQYCFLGYFNRVHILDSCLASSES